MIDTAIDSQSRGRMRFGSRSSAIAVLGVSFLALSAIPAFCDENLKTAVKSLAKQKSLTDTPDGPKDQLRRYGVDYDVWMTQFYQGMAAGVIDRPARYGGKMDAFLRIDGEKLGLWSGFKGNVQYEHYFGRDLNDAPGSGVLPVNTANGFIRRDGYHSGLSINFSQQIGDLLTISAGKFNMVTLSGATPLKGGDGVGTFMHVGLAAPISGVTPPYIIGGMATLKTTPAIFTLMVYDPRNAQPPRVLERPFEKGTTFSVSATVPTQFFGLTGSQSLRGAYSTKRGVELEDIPQLLLPKAARPALGTKKGYWFLSYAFQQNLFQSADNPAIGWGLFAQAGLSDGNPNPIRWSVIAGVGGNNLVKGRENDLWGVGYLHYGFSRDLLSGLTALGLDRRGESGIEAFYNIALTPWLRLTGDAQFIEPWNTAVRRTTIMAARLQTKF